MGEAAEGPDWAAIIEQMRRGDAEAERMAYRRTFGGPVGRMVLAHILAKAGVGAQRGRGVDAEGRAYADGLADGALQIAERVGFDQFSAVVTVMTDTMEGQTHEHPMDGLDGDAQDASLTPD